MSGRTYNQNTDEQMLLKVIGNGTSVTVDDDIDRQSTEDVVESLLIEDRGEIQEVVSFYKEGMFRLPQLDPQKQIFNLDSLNKRQGNNLILYTSQNKNQQQNVVREIFTIKLPKSRFANNLCDLLNNYHNVLNTNGNKMNIYSALIVLDKFTPLHRVPKKDVIRAIVFMSIVNEFIEEVRHSLIVENNSVILNTRVECFKEADENFAILNIEATTNSVRTNKTKVSVMFAKCINEDVLGRPHLLFCYANACGIRYENIYDFVGDFYGDIYRSMSIGFCYVASQTDSADKIKANSEVLKQIGDAVNQSFVSHVLIPLLSRTHEFYEITYSQTSPAMFVHGGRICEDSINTTKLLQTLFTCNESFSVTRHGYDLFIEPKSCNGSPLICLTSGCENTRKNNTNIFQRFGLNPKKKAVHTCLFSGAQNIPRSQRTNILPMPLKEVEASHKLRCCNLGYALFNNIDEFQSIYQKLFNNSELTFDKIVITDKIKKDVSNSLDKIIEETPDQDELLTNCYIVALRTIAASKPKAVSLR